MSTGFHPIPYADSLGYEIAVKLFRFLTIFQSLLCVVSVSVSTNAICWNLG